MAKRKVFSLAVSASLVAFLTACHLSPLANRPIPGTGQSVQAPDSQAVPELPGHIQWLKTYQTQALPDSSLLVSTVAGDGTEGYQDGVATSSVLGYVQCVAIDSKGNVFFVDQLSMIRKLSPDGMVSTFAGSLTRGFTNGAGASAAFNYPRDIAIDSDDTLYVADTDNNVIRKITPAGIVSTFAGTGEAVDRDGEVGAASFDHPMALSISRTGTLLVGDNTTAIREIVGSTVRTKIPALPSSFACLGLVEDGNGTIFTITMSGVRPYLLRIDPDGTMRGVSAGANFFPMGLALDASNNVYMTTLYGSIWKLLDNSLTLVTGAGVMSFGYADGPANTAMFNIPRGLAIGKDGSSLYVADTGNYRIRKIAADNPMKLEVETPYFSPNNDQVLDTATLSVKAVGSWTLSVSGLGPIATGSGDVTYLWDGKVKDVALPDGKYTLQADVGSHTLSTRSITIDTVKPVINDLSVDGKAEYQVTQNLVPEVKAGIQDSLSGVEGTGSIDLRFNRYIDDYSTMVYENSEQYDLKSGAFAYRVPFEEDSFLYPGDQYVEVTATDRAGNKQSKKFWFAVGSHNLFSGVPGRNDPRPAYAAVRIAAAQKINLPPTRPLSTYRVLPKYQDYAIKRFNPDRMEFGLKPPAQIGGAFTPAYYGYVVLGATAAGVATFVFFDEAFESIDNFLHRERAFLIHTENGKGVATLS